MSVQPGRLGALALRDLAVFGATLCVWTLLGQSGVGGAWPIVLAVLAAVLTAVCGFLLHEWGHLAGAVLARGQVELPSSPFTSPFLFSFENARNTVRQYCFMSLGGFAASIAAVIAFVWVLPPGALATKLALGLTVLGVIATFVLEVPPFWRAWRTGVMPGPREMGSSPPAG